MNQNMRTVLGRAGVDTEGTIRRFSGNAELYEKFLFKFPKDPSFSEISAALEQENYEQAYKAAHTLKGASANLGMDRISGACSKIVTLYRSGETGEIREAFGELKAEYEKLCSIIENESQEN